MPFDGGPTGEERFQKLLVEGAYTRAWRYAYHLSGNREEAEDLLQDALVQAYLRFDQLRGHDRFAAWLIAIVRTQFLMQRRRASNRQSQPLPLIESCSELDSFARLVIESMASLPSQQRELLTLHYLEQLSFDEIGVVLKTNPNRLRQRLLRARRALRQQVELLQQTDRSVASHSTGGAN